MSDETVDRGTRLTERNENKEQNLQEYEAKKALKREAKKARTEEQKREEKNANEQGIERTIDEKTDEILKAENVPLESDVEETFNTIRQSVLDAGIAYNYIPTNLHCKYYKLMGTYFEKVKTGTPEAYPALLKRIDEFAFHDGICTEGEVMLSKLRAEKRKMEAPVEQDVNAEISEMMEHQRQQLAALESEKQSLLENGKTQTARIGSLEEALAAEQQALAEKNRECESTIATMTQEIIDSSAKANALELQMMEKERDILSKNTELELCKDREAELSEIIRKQQEAGSEIQQEALDRVRELASKNTELKLCKDHETAMSETIKKQERIIAKLKENEILLAQTTTALQESGAAGVGYAAEIEQQRAEIIKLQADLAQEREKETALVASAAENTRLQAALDAEKKKLQEEQHAEEALRMKANSEMDELRKQLAALSLEKDDNHNASLQEIASEKEKCAERISNLEEQIKSLEDELAEAIAVARESAPQKEAEIERLRAEIKKLQADLVEAHAALVEHTQAGLSADPARFVKSIGNRAIVVHGANNAAICEPIRHVPPANMMVASRLSTASQDPFLAHVDLCFIVPSSTRMLKNSVFALQGGRLILDNASFRAHARLLDDDAYPLVLGSPGKHFEAIWHARAHQSTAAVGPYVFSPSLALAAVFGAFSAGGHTATEAGILIQRHLRSMPSAFTAPLDGDVSLRDWAAASLSSAFVAAKNYSDRDVGYIILFSDAMHAWHAAFVA